MKRRDAIAAAALAGVLPARAQAPTSTAPPKVLRYAFRVAETSLDPVKIIDLYSRTLTPHIFESLYKYDHLARPVKVKPLTAAGEPEPSEDFRVWTVRLQRGIYFATDPAFKGKRRELVAQDYVYSLKRFADPANTSPGWTSFEADKYVGLGELRQAALDGKKPFDYDREIEGARAIDRYTIRFRLEEPRPRFPQNLAASDIFGAVAREVVEFYGDQVDGHPVGTGPFKLVQWRRSSRIVFERSAEFRELLYDAEPAEGDAEGQALLARFRGRRLPMIDRVEISVVEEDQPRWLSFVNGEADFIERVPATFVGTAMPGGKVAPNLAKRGVRGYREVEPGSSQLFFNMESPMVGGYTPTDVALRRAVGLALDLPREALLIRKGQATLAQTPIIPSTSAYNPAERTEFGDYDPARAKGLLDTFGFIDRDGDGWRERPDGSPLLLEVSTQPDNTQRQLDELLKQNMDAIGVRIAFKFAQWPENLKAARSGKFMVWTVGSSADAPDSIGAFARYDSHQIGGQNMGRFKLPVMDELYRRLKLIPDGPERNALFAQAVQLAVAYAPYKFRLSRILTDLAYPQLVGYRRAIFWQEWWHYVDIDPTAPSRSS